MDGVERSPAWLGRPHAHVLCTDDDGHGDRVPGGRRGEGVGKERTRTSTYISGLFGLSSTTIALEERYRLLRQGIQRERVWGGTYAVGDAAVDVACFKDRTGQDRTGQEAKGAEALYRGGAAVG
jgi:hypothetical protein